MARLMSCSATEQAVVDRTKTVTRRLGWRFLEPGDQLTLCRKVMGRKRADGTVEPLVRLAEVTVESVVFEPLWMIAWRADDVAREGVPDVETPTAFIEFYSAAFSCNHETVITRIEWSYNDD